MKFETVKGREMLAQGTGSDHRRKISLSGRRYDLARALLIVREMDTSPGRAAVYEEIKSKNAIFRLADRLYALSGKPLFQPFILWLYMVKCVLTVGPTSGGGKAVSIANFPNEEHTIDRVITLVPDVSFLRLTLRRKHMIGRGQLTEFFRLVRSLVRAWPFLRTLARRYSFMPAARIASALAFYIRYNALFADRPDLSAAVVASNYSPEAVGMAAAAHGAGRKVIYANHASVAANGPVVPPVHADLALFYGEETADIYRRRSACTADVALIGQPGKTQEMEFRERLARVGIFLTAGTRIDTLSALIRDIRESHPTIEILVRDHPVALLRNDLSTFVLEDPRVKLTIGNPLSDEIAACDLVICGNSGVALNAVSGGRPVAYLADMDNLPFDYIGLVGAGLIPCVEGWSDDLYARLKSFYSAPDWVASMRRFDASYCADILSINREAGAALRALLEC